MSKRFERDEEKSSPKMAKSKAERILESKMPEEQKQAALKEIGHIVEKAPEGVPFSVYAKAKKIEKSQVKAMEVYPKAKGVSLATMNQWDEIFKDF